MAPIEPEPYADNIERLIGSRIRARRLSLGLDQRSLGRAVGLTAGQVEDFETGATRIGASRLAAMAEALHVPILFFFGDQPANADPASPDAVK